MDADADADIVVAGADHNSLIAACYLAKAGYRCLVLDTRLATHPRGRLWQRRRQLSAWDVIRHEFRDRHVQAFMLWMAFQTNQAVDVPGSGVLAYSLIFGRQQRSWSIVPGGSGQVVSALVRYLEDHGGTVRCPAGTWPRGSTPPGSLRTCAGSPRDSPTTSSKPSSSCRPRTTNS